MEMETQVQILDEPIYVSLHAIISNSLNDAYTGEQTAFSSLSIAICPEERKCWI